LLALFLLLKFLTLLCFTYVGPWSSPTRRRRSSGTTPSSV